MPLTMMLHRRKELRTNLIKNMKLNLRRNVAKIYEIYAGDIFQKIETGTLQEKLLPIRRFLGSTTVMTLLQGTYEHVRCKDKNINF